MNMTIEVWLEQQFHWYECNYCPTTTCSIIFTTEKWCISLPLLVSYDLSLVFIIFMTFLFTWTSEKALPSVIAASVSCQEAVSHNVTLRKGLWVKKSMLVCILQNLTGTFGIYCIWQMYLDMVNLFWPTVWILGRRNRMKTKPGPDSNPHFGIMVYTSAQWADRQP